MLEPVSQYMTDADSSETFLRDDVFDALASARRRYILSVLQDHEMLALADIADEIATWEHDAPLPEITPETVKDIYVSLHHRHLPKLVDSGLVIYDDETELVGLADAGRAVDPDIDPTVSGQATP